MADGPTYSREEMDAILKRALERQAAKPDDGVAHEDLVAAAIEVGIPREEVEAAASELAQQKSVQAESRVLDHSRGKAVRTWVAGAASWAVMSGFFYVLCMVLHQGWWIWPVLGWGLGIALSGIRLFIGGDSSMTTGAGCRANRDAKRDAKRGPSVIARSVKRRSKISKRASPSAPRRCFACSIS